MDLSKIPEIVALTIENSKFTWIDFCLFFVFFLTAEERNSPKSLQAALQSLKTAFEKTSAIDERVETTGRSRHRHFGVGQNR